MKPDLSIDLAGIKMKNPVMNASGPFGCGREYAQFIDLSELGAIVVKSITLKEQRGNPPPRICETASGILNSIGLQNKGVDRFIREDLPHLRNYNVPIIVNVAGGTIDEYVAVCDRLNHVHGVSGIELNISCPNVKKGGAIFGSSSRLASKVVREVRRVTNLPLIVKLTPNVTDIVKIARSVEIAGADGVSLINTLLGMCIDVETFRPELASIVGGLSGPAIKPIAIRMVWQVAQATNIPIIGMGGIASVKDAIEFFLAGATAIAIGTANLIDPRITIEIIRGLEKFLEEKGFETIWEIVGKVRID
ncbi:MAG: dihydroorotate dehydrogenase [Actinomycetota bacterium]